VEVECRCGGLELVDIPSNLASDVHRMWVDKKTKSFSTLGWFEHWTLPHCRPTPLE
jgi:hypothetical protein